MVSRLISGFVCDVWLNYVIVRGSRFIVVMFCVLRNVVS